ncbi:3-hydroxybutyryl-CoA dehydrogenase [bacterium]|nr:3-hydroxybutyryl-CoA dehydrogenase [bacterium]
MGESGLSKIGVIGIGAMGSGIAQVAAQGGFTTVVVDLSQEALERGMGVINKSLDRLVASYEKSGGEKGISAENRDVALGRLTTTTELKDLLDCGIIIEAIVEKAGVKEEVFRDLAGLGYDKLLASNTSSISITRLAAACAQPEKFMGMHFMNPVPLQRGVEIIRGLMTSDETYNTIAALCHDLGKVEIPAEDKAGFGINRMWIPFVNEAVRVVEEGVMAPDEADKCTLCLGHKMGPLTTADFVGLDVILFVCNVLEQEFGSAYKASPLLKRLVEAGQLGAKSGMGFYKWEAGKPAGVNPAVQRYRVK